MITCISSYLIHSTQYSLPFSIKLRWCGLRTNPIYSVARGLLD